MRLWKIVAGSTLLAGLSSQVACTKVAVPTPPAAVKNTADEKCDEQTLQKRDTNNAFVFDLFCRILGRPGGATSSVFMRRLKDGTPRIDIFKEFLLCKEFKYRTDPLSDEKYIALLIDRILSRPPQAGEIARWTARMKQEKWNRDRVAVELVYTSESRQKNKI